MPKSPTPIAELAIKAKCSYSLEEMSDLPTINPALYKALEIFLDELSSHTNWLQQQLQVLALAKENDSFLPECRALAKQIEHRFHQIKGGAGFLSLDLIRDNAIKGEDMFKGGVIQSQDSAEILSLLSESISLFQKRQEALRKLISTTAS